MKRTTIRLGPLQPDRRSSAVLHGRCRTPTPRCARTILATSSVTLGPPLKYTVLARGRSYRAFLTSQYHWEATAARRVWQHHADILTTTSRPKGPRLSNACLDTLHYSWVNPFAWCISAICPVCATRSVNEIFHAWFAHGTNGATP